MTFTFDRETALIPLNDDQYTIEASEVYRNPTGMNFGGWVAAICARAVEMHPERTSPLVSQQVIYISGVGPGEVLVDVKLLRSGASTQFWRVQLIQNGAPVIAADMVTSNRRPTDLNYQLKMPEARPPEECDYLHREDSASPAWTTYYDQRIVSGVPFSVNEIPEAVVWIKETDERPLDRISITSICDTPMPRTFFLSDELRMGSTVAMSTYIYASDEDFETAGSDYLLLRVDGATARNSATDSRVELWSRGGILLATSNQIGFFR